jgi:gas vesicle protein
MPCIEKLIKDGENGFKCPVCADFHEIPSKGYIKNFNLDQISDKQANEVTRGSLADTLKAQLGEFKQNTDELANWIESSSNKINKHCNDLRSEVSLSTDKLIQSIYNLKSELVCQIDDYETDLNANCEISGEYKAKLAQLLNETNGIHAKWADYLKQFELNDQDLEIASAQVNAWLESVKNELGVLAEKVFGGRFLRFFENKHNNSSSIIGTLGHDASHLINQKQLNELKMYKFGDKLNYSRDHRYAIGDSLRVQLLDNENICMAYQYIVIGSPYSTLETDIYLSVFDSSLDRLRTKCFDEYIVGEFKLAKLDGSILLCLIQPKEKEAETDESDLNLDDGSSIMKFDQDLNLLNEISVEYKIKAVDGFGSHLYCLSNIHNVNRQVFVYDANLKQLMSIGQHADWNKPFYISNTFEKMGKGKSGKRGKSGKTSKFLSGK